MSKKENVDWVSLRSRVERKLGKLSIEFSKLETDLACAISYFISPNVSLGQVVAAELSSKGKVSLFSSLYLQRSSDATAIAALKQCRKRFEEVELRRNHLIHSFYWPDPSGAPALLRIKTTAKPAKGLQFESERVTPESIDGVLQAVSNAGCLLRTAMGHVERNYKPHFERFHETFRISSKSTTTS